MPPLPTPNEKAPAVMICKGLRFVLMTTRLTPGKDNRREFIQQHVAAFKAH